MRKFKSAKMGFGPLPPKELADMVRAAVLRPPSTRPPPPHIADSLPEGMTDMDPEPDRELKLPEPTVLIKERQADELVPAITTGRVSRSDLPRLLNEWQSRLTEAFPSMAPSSWVRVLGAVTDVSTVFFRKSERAVVFASLEPRYVFAISVKSVATLDFLFHKDLGPEGGSVSNSEGEKQALALVRELRNWARQLGATEVRGFETCCDLPYGRLHGRFILEKREQIILKVA